MTFTFSSNDEIDYAKLGMCPVCAIRFTHGCEHSNTQEAQEWLAAYAVSEQIGADGVDEFIGYIAKPHPVEEAYRIEKAEHEDWLDNNRTMEEARY